MSNTDKLTVKLNINDNVATALRKLNIGELTPEVRGHLAVPLSIQL